MSNRGSIGCGCRSLPTRHPIARVAQVADEEEHLATDFTPNPEGPDLPPGTGWTPRLPETKVFWPDPRIPGKVFPIRLCSLELGQGCYRLEMTPSTGSSKFNGTLRVEQGESGALTVSGDLYRFKKLAATWTPRGVRLGLEGPIFVGKTQQFYPIKLNIPIYSRASYYSYLLVTSVSRPLYSKLAPCKLTIYADEYVYTHPATGSYDGTFPSTATRQIKMVLEQHTTPSGYVDSYYEGTAYVGNVAIGTVKMGRVSSFFRRATLEIDAVTGAAMPPATVPAGTSTESFQTVFASAGWSLTVTRDQTAIPVPTGVTATNCWSFADLHALMVANRRASTNLDTEWRTHLICVPARLGCSRGVMYDSIDVPREGAATFSDDGYPTGDSSFFGTAANQMQRNVPRAFLRSASHEVGHAFNQVHQEGEGGADNSIMTTTPSVADVLGSATSGAPGVFPDDIHLGFNEHVRHHLIHAPDPVVRPGGMTFGASHSGPVEPEADRDYYAVDELELAIVAKHDRIELGEPLQLRYELKNKTGSAIPVPRVLTQEADAVTISVIDPSGAARRMPSFIIQDQGGLTALEPGESMAGSANVFWSSQGFAFEKPGRHTVQLAVSWSAGGMLLGVRSSIAVWVNYPATDAANEAAQALLHPEVGMFVALGGGAHLKEAQARLRRVEAMGSKAAAMRGFASMLPAKGKGSKA